MNSCLPVLISTDAMHGFLRDKQAWENAISMYQGPDPLDHWYNYICWYENHLRGDPENKFRETLERCLALFEHSDFYKQDLRMVRLWLKYIEMQTHPLHFYQVLYQRGVGRQVAAFYIGWAGYYQSIQALKEAESVFSLAFQEKAQSYDELSHAHNKFLYMQTAAAHIAMHHQQQLPGLQLTQHQQSPQIHYQQLECVHLLTHSQPQLQQESHTIPHQTAQMESQGHTPQLQNFHRQQTTATASNSYYQPHAHANMAVQQDQLYQLQAYQNELNFQTQTEHSTITNKVNGSTRTVHPSDSEGSWGTAQEKATKGNYCNTYEKAACSAPQIDQSRANAVELLVTKLSSTSSPVGSCKLPRKFAAYCRNNYETWKPALFLEEPEDPNRRCHYAKHFVYPGTGVEYSPEELRAKKYITCVTPSNSTKQGTYQCTENERNGQELQEIGSLQQQQQSIDEGSLTEIADRAHTLSHKYRKSTCEKLGLNGADLSDHNLQNTISHAQKNIQQRSAHNHNLNEVQQKLLQEDRKLIYETGNTLDDLEDQIGASTIRLGEKKTIKIKFKKEPQQQGHTLKGNNYVIEGIYQQEVKYILFCTVQADLFLVNPIVDNGINF
ncbi:PREDICTED: uncharacterized protein LOC108364936 [Rhagoletis zephyria]|uniref:uncharacterized protein LOC108364936 n=1 Tax=Rhagoletis zephyria TaxID=28612 RepID=UPI00081185B0|nr:PREDICTED: uncharacterized protein LOC108364936 [Rhagoletis zephyria]